MITVHILGNGQLISSRLSGNHDLWFCRQCQILAVPNDWTPDNFELW